MAAVTAQPARADPDVRRPSTSAVGGEPTFRKLVDEFYAGVADDPLLRPLYPEEDLGPAADRLRLFLMQYWGGPGTYSAAARPPAAADAARAVPGRPGRARRLAAPHARARSTRCDLDPEPRHDALGLPGAGRPLHGQHRWTTPGATARGADASCRTAG